MRTPLLRSQLGEHRLMWGSRPSRGRDALLSKRQVVRTPNGMEFMLNSVSLKPQYSSPESIHILLHPCYRSTESGVVLHGCDASICRGRGWGGVGKMSKGSRSSLATGEVGNQLKKRVFPY